MVQAAFLLLLGMGGSILALLGGWLFLSQCYRDRMERTCQLNEYFNWIMNKGSTEQQKLAIQLKEKRDLEALKDLVGFGILVDN